MPTSQPRSESNTPPTLAVVILNWNAADDTLSCLAHVAAWQGVEARVWVVDNGSHAADRQLLAECMAHLSLHCTLLENANNLGFAGGTNRGLAAALAAGDWPVLLLNNDARIDDAGLRHMLTVFAADERIGWLGAPLYHDGKLHSVGRRNPVLHHNSLITALPQTPLLEVAFISGSVALVRAALLRQIGLLDEDYFFNTEVADHCHRAREAGYKTVVDCQVRAEHNLDRSGALRSTLYVYYIIRNRFVYLYKRYQWARWPLLLFWAGYSLLLVVKLWLQGERATATAVWLGMVDGVGKRWGGQNGRVLAACGGRTSPHASSLPNRAQKSP